MPDIPIRRRAPDEVRERLAASGFPGDFIDTLTEDTERQRMVADAILLERAARVLERRIPADAKLAHHALAWVVLMETAAAWRLEAEE